MLHVTYYAHLSKTQVQIKVYAFPQLLTSRSQAVTTWLLFVYSQTDSTGTRSLDCPLHSRTDKDMLAILKHLLQKEGNFSLKVYMPQFKKWMN